jgi:hydrogenase-4 component B
MHTPFPLSVTPPAPVPPAPLLAIDGLSALFLVLVLVVAGLAWTYAPAYLAQPHYRGESRLRFHALFALFVAGMAGTLVAANLLVFLVCWEVMALASYVLVAYETGDGTVLRAAFKYFVMTHVGTAGLMLAFILLWVWGGTFSFAAVPATLARLAADQPGLLHVVLALLFVGFATKAGLYPFGDWLPDAHPAAPAPVSAVLSGVMVKLGLYGFLRLFVWMLAASSPAAAVAWGYPLMGFGLLSALIGGMAAAAALDTKVLLAYSSIAQSGLVALGIGAALVLAPAHPALAALALLGAAFHLVADALLKSLLFLVAGSLQFRSGSRRLEDLGGLFEAMPRTGFAALVGCLGIAGFPPLAAFVSKWLMLESMVASAVPVVTLAGLGLLVASLLSILYAAKLFVAAFANRPMRTESLEVPAGMWIPQAALAALAVLLGVVPGPCLRALAQVFSAAPAGGAGPAAAAWRALALTPPTGALAPLVLVMAGLLVFVLALAALGRGGQPRHVGMWLGGAAHRSGVSHARPQGMYAPVRTTLGRAYPRLAFPALKRPGWVLPAINAELWLYRPAMDWGRRGADVLRRLHTGVPHRYIAWQLLGAAALAALLLLLLRLGP